MAGPVLGLDPGARETGIVVVDGLDLLDHATVKGPTLGKLAPDVDYLRDVVEVAEALMAEHGPSLAAIEGIRQTKRVDPSALRHLGPVVGVLAGLAMLRQVPVVIVSPDGHGGELAQAYPVGLHDPGGCGGKKDKRCTKRCAAPGGAKRHERSAYDVARLGRIQYRLDVGARRAAARRNDAVPARGPGGQ